MRRRHVCCSCCCVATWLLAGGEPAYLFTAYTPEGEVLGKITQYPGETSQQAVKRFCETSSLGEWCAALAQASGLEGQVQRPSFVVRQLRNDTESLPALRMPIAGQPRRGGCRQPQLSGRWLLATADAAGLCNQLLAVLGWARAAQLLGAQGIIIGPMYSRLSFDQAWGELHAAGGHRQLPFSAFFDAEHYAHAWRRRGLQVVGLGDVEGCAWYAARNAVVLQKEHTRYQSAAASDAEMAAARRQLDAFVAAQQPQQPGGGPHIVHFLPDMVALYDFHQAGAEPQFSALREAVSSLRPSVGVAAAAEHVLRNLPQNFPAVHLRIEADALATDLEALEGMRAYVRELKAVFPPEQGRWPPPCVYVSSGIYQPGVVPSRAAVADAMFDAAGVCAVSKESLAERDGELRALLAALAPEQKALVDLTVMRRAATLVLSRARSSFSYMVMRLRDLDQHPTGLSFDPVFAKSANAFFYDWGI